LRRIALAATLPLLLISLWLAPDAGSRDSTEDHWVGTWACSPQLADSDPAVPASGFADTTLRQVVHVSVGGNKIRVRFSNAFGNGLLTISSAHIARADGTKIQAASDTALSFHGQSSVNIPSGALMYSDPVDFDLPPVSDLAVTIHVASSPEHITSHQGARATSEFTHGDWVSASELPAAERAEHWYFLNGVDVAGHSALSTVVILGDSISDGKNSTTDGNGRWTDELARRLHGNKRMAKVGVLNEGIGGNRLLHDGLGPNALARFDRDVLAQSGVRWLIVLEGVNDIGTCKEACDLDGTANAVIAAYQQVIVRAHSHGIRVYGATIMPFGGSFYASPEAERARQTVNSWIRTSGRFDAVIDFDALTHDPQSPSNLLSGVDSGDHLHPADAGYKTMGDSIDLKLFAK
jgi:lysophospholipase L1-like esterase